MNKPTQRDIFLTFLIIGATSFGGGVVAYLRDAMVEKRKWISDTEFRELMSIRNTLPGLNATNMAILGGDRLGGTLGSILAMLGMCLPAFVFMTAAGMAYASHVERPLVDAALKGVAAAAVGLIAATWFKIGKKSLHGFYDALFVLASIMGVNYFKLGVPLTLLIVGGVAIVTFRPQAPAPQPVDEDEQWIKSLG